MKNSIRINNKHKIKNKLIKIINRINNNKIKMKIINKIKNNNKINTKLTYQKYLVLRRQINKGLIIHIITKQNKLINRN